MLKLESAILDKHGLRPHALVVNGATHPAEPAAADEKPRRPAATAKPAN